MRHIRPITIVQVLNGYRVQVGCQELVFPDSQTLCEALESYCTNPTAAETRYMRNVATIPVPAQDAQPDCGPGQTVPMGIGAGVDLAPMPYVGPIAMANQYANQPCRS